MCAAFSVLANAAQIEFCTLRFEAAVREAAPLVLGQRQPAVM